MVYNMFFFVYLNKLRLIGISTYCFKKFIFVYKVVYVAIIPRVYYVIFIYQKKLTCIVHTYMCNIICKLRKINICTDYSEYFMGSRIYKRTSNAQQAIGIRGIHNAPVCASVQFLCVFIPYLIFGINGSGHIRIKRRWV
ncbi:unknown [Firmicutes bacterium CAG:41]|nr:unknown [Firmicutes bacterium CAG:41]